METLQYNTGCQHLRDISFTITTRPQTLQNSLPVSVWFIQLVSDYVNNQNIVKLNSTLIIIIMIYYYYYYYYYRDVKILPNKMKLTL